MAKDIVITRPYPVLLMMLIIVMTAQLSFGQNAGIAGKAGLSGQAGIGNGPTSTPSNVTYDNSAKGGGGVAVYHQTISIVVGNHANRLLLVFPGGGDATIGDRTVDSVTSDLDGALTLVSSGSADDANWTRMESWKLVAPSVGTHTITVQYATEGGGNWPDQSEAFAISLYGVDQSSPIGTPTVVNGSVASATPTGSVTLGSDDMAVGAIATDSDSTLSFTAGTQQQATLGVQSDTCYGLATRTGTGSIAITASTASQTYSLVVLPINGAP